MTALPKTEPGNVPLFPLRSSIAGQLLASIIHNLEIYSVFPELSWHKAERDVSNTNSLGNQL